MVIIITNVTLLYAIWGHHRHRLRLWALKVNGSCLFASVYTLGDEPYWQHLCTGWRL